MFRVDVRDTLFDLLFERHKINILSAPHAGLVPGKLVVTVGESAFGPMDASTVLSGLDLPDPVSEPMVDIEETSTSVRDTKAQLSFLEKLLGRFLPAGWVPSISAKVEAKGAAQAFARFRNVHRDFLDIGALAQAVYAKPVTLGMFSTGEDAALYIISDVFRATDIKMTWLDEHGLEIGAEAGIPDVASLQGARTTKTLEKGALKGAGPELCFGIRLLPIAVENGSSRLQLVHSPANVLGDDDDLDDFAVLGADATLQLLVLAELQDPDA